MIPILKRFCDSFYMVLVDDKTLPTFLTEYVFNYPESTTIEFQGMTQTDGEVEIEFYKFPKGFAYCHDVESEFYEKAVALASKYYPEDPEDEDCPVTVTPDVLLDMLTTFIDPIVNMYKDGDCVHIRTSPPEDVGYPEEFSTVGYIEMKHTQNSRFEGKRVYRSLLDLPHLCDEYCNHTPPPDNVDTSSDNLREEDSSEVSSDIASNNMNASLDTSDTKPLEDSSNLLVASNNMQLDKMDDIPSDNRASNNVQMDKMDDIPSDNMASNNVQMDETYRWMNSKELCNQMLEE
ncbi:hypothetical protein TNCV_528241 [Trichonephila clavipes]|nr:hypothetical protein TNCV_528241 [Trichonephila clavipes]